MTHFPVAVVLPKGVTPTDKGEVELAIHRLIAQYSEDPEVLAEVGGGEGGWFADGSPLRLVDDWRSVGWSHQRAELRPPLQDLHHLRWDRSPAGRAGEIRSGVV